MTRLSDILMPLYNKQLAGCEEQKIALNLDLPDPTAVVEDAKNIEKIIKKLLKDAMKRIGKKGSITIGAKRGVKHALIITVKDSGAALTREEREKLEEDETVTVRSRMGYGTTITVRIPAQ